MHWSALADPVSAGELRATTNTDGSIEVWGGGWRVRFPKAPTSRPAVTKDPPPDDAGPVPASIQVGEDGSGRLFLRSGNWRVVFQPSELVPPRVNTVIPQVLEPGHLEVLLDLMPPPEQ